MKESEIMENKTLWIPRRDLFILCGLSLTAVLIYLLVADADSGVFGFPLDDAWIHQVYARNLGQLGLWGFSPDRISAGSTSPLWTFLLSPGYLLNSEPAYLWTYFLSWLGLSFLGIFAESISRRIILAYRPWFPWVGAAVILEWHQVWAAVSGMETSWMAAVILFVFYLLLDGNKNYAWAAFFTGIAVWIRPDGITLLGPVLVLVIIRAFFQRKNEFRSNLSIFLAFAIPFTLYLFFNHQIGGNIWPNTMFAKHAEYSELLQSPILKRVIQLIVLPFTGAGVLTIPGFLYGTWKAIKKKNWDWLVMVIWWLGYTAIYAMRLPVTYQHGRYLMPAMPVYFLLGIMGTLFIFYDLPKTRPTKIFKKVLISSFLAILLAFLLLGANAYQQDRKIIESEMVNTAQWISKNVSPQSKIAVHDIGAVGFFTNNEIVDLAGLVTPEVIPFIRDEVKLKDYLDDQRVSFLVTFPGWYQDLTKGLLKVYESKGTTSPAEGGENMAIYLWQTTKE